MLVPQNELSRLRKLEESKMDDNSVEVFRLDEEIAKLLSTKDISEYDKSRLYADLLRKFLDYQQKRNQISVSNTPAATLSLPIPTVNPQISANLPGDEKTLDNSQDVNSYSREDILSTVPEKYKGKAQSLLKLLKRQPSLLSWNDKGEIIYKGKVAQGSHVSDLVRSAIVPKAQSDLEGASLFTQALSEMNLPQGALGNKTFREAMQEKRLSTLKGGYPKSSQKTLMSPESSFSTPKMKGSIRGRTRVAPYSKARVKNRTTPTSSGGGKGKTKTKSNNKRAQTPIPTWLTVDE